MFYLLDAKTGVATSSLAAVRTIILIYYARKEKVAPFWLMLLMVLSQICAVAVAWTGWISLALLIPMANIYGQWQTDVKVTRVCVIIACTGFMTYCLVMGAYTNAVNEMILICSASIALWRYRKDVVV